ncbi:hypothetical protein [Chitinophaga caseinilytica]|uniref:hypothetical protein n=1 Tax=Chitinophaga caseinilytica TaxID=2267521 RepID=UPI003C2F9B16
MKKAIQIFSALALLLTMPMWAAAQCSWSISATVDSSRCAASGKINVTLQGPDAGSVTNITYRLKATGGTYEIPQTASPNFENLAAGQYAITARGICNGAADSVMYTVTVPGNYQPFSAEARLGRASFPNCASGQLALTFQNGRRNYKAVITAKPAAYTGATTFTVNGTSFVIDNLPQGSYTLVLSDSCGSAAAPVTITVPDVPYLLDENANFDNAVQNIGCNRFRFRAPFVGWNALHLPYVFPGSPWKYAVSYEGGAKTEFRSIGDGNPFELDMPAGKTVKDMLNANVYYYLKSPCGQETTFPVKILQSIVMVTYSNNCANSFNITPMYNAAYVCYPIVINVTNRNTGVAVRDTAFDWSGWRMDSIPFGQYNIRVVTADSLVMFQENVERVPPPQDPYRAGFNAYPNGYHNYGDAYIWMGGLGSVKAGTKLEVIHPASHAMSLTLPYDMWTAYLSGPSVPVFRPGTYVIKTTDDCNVNYDTLIVKEEDVYKYEFEIDTRDTCYGTVVNVTGTAKYGGNNIPGYYRIYDGPQGWPADYGIRPFGTEMALPYPGTYNIIVGAYPERIDWNADGGNRKMFEWQKRALIINTDRTYGWICPGAAPNSGSIRVYLVDPYAGTYTYSVAAAGQGATGPYIATNTTGNFNSGSGYQLMVNQNYDVKVTDPCGASVVQTIKINDFSVAQIASLNKPAYCVGDEARLEVINLPGEHNTFSWTGPNSLSVNLQNYNIPRLEDHHAGKYYLEIQSDICPQPIRDTVDLVITEYEIICFSAVTDTSVNPYATGLMGNWRPHRSYAYYGERKETDPLAATNIRKDGTYKDFLSFWKKQSSGWKAQYDTTRWVWNAEATIFNKKGFELENRDALNRHNSAIYGFDDALPVAMTQNSMLREAAYEGFEDYYFRGNGCATGECATARRFDFSNYISWLDTTRQHTGRYSIKIPAGDTLQTSHFVTAAPVAAGLPVFEKVTDNCTGATVLKKVKADSTMIIPPYSPLSGKKVLFSAWVKEEKDCNCAAYENNVVQLIVKQGGTTTRHEFKPSGNIIEGWQRYEEAVDLPAGTTQLSLMIIAKGTSPVYVDDIRLHPFNANMKSWAYDPVTLRMMAELDENNFATFFEYDDDGVLIRVKKETERGVKTIKETRSGLVKE